MTSVEEQQTLTFIDEFLATRLLGWTILDDWPGAWFDPESGICLYSRGQSSKFEENWHPTYVLNQALYCFEKLNKSASITFDANDTDDWKYVVEIKADHSIGNGNTLQRALSLACAEYLRWRDYRP